MTKPSEAEIERRRKEAAERALAEAEARRQSEAKEPLPKGGGQPQGPRAHALRRLGKEGHRFRFLAPACHPDYRSPRKRRRREWNPYLTPGQAVCLRGDDARCAAELSNMVSRNLPDTRPCKSARFRRSDADLPAYQKKSPNVLLRRLRGFCCCALRLLLQGGVVQRIEILRLHARLPGAARLRLHPRREIGAVVGRRLRSRHILRHGFGGASGLGNQKRGYGKNGQGRRLSCLAKHMTSCTTR